MNKLGAIFQKHVFADSVSCCVWEKYVCKIYVKNTYPPIYAGQYAIPIDKFYLFSPLHHGELTDREEMTTVDIQ